MSNENVVEETFLEKDTNTLRLENTLLHGETLLIVTTRNPEDVSFVFITEARTFHFFTKMLIEERTTEKQVSK